MKPRPLSCLHPATLAVDKNGDNRPRSALIGLSKKHGAGGGEQTTLLHPLQSSLGSPVGKPLTILSNRKLLLAALANGLGRRPNMVADDFVDRLAGWAEIEKVIHCHDPLSRLLSISVNDNQKQSF
jgi:hypothetical protein